MENENSSAYQLSAITVVEREAYMPLSLAQQRLWELTQIDSASAAYHLGGAMKLEGALDCPALQRAFQRVVDRHEALRTQFVLVDGQPMQAIVAEARIVPSFHDLRDHEDREAIARSLNDAFMAKPFDLRDDLPLRVQLIRLEDQVHELQVVMHHIVSDGWSIRIMLNEFSRLYAADVQDRSDPLPALPIQYLDYSQWQRQWLEEDQLARQTAFWQRNLAGAPTLLELPTDRRRPAQQDFLGDTLDVRLDAMLTASLKELSQRYGVTLYVTLLASWAAVLGRLSNQDDVVIGSQVEGRNHAEIEPLIGLFVNTIAFRVDLSGEPTLSDLLKRTHQQVLDAQAHQDLPFDQVVEAVKPPREMACSPVFQTMLLWQNQEQNRLEMPGISVSAIERLSKTTQFDLTLNLSETEGEIAGVLSYATALFDRETISRYLGYWCRLLSSIQAQCLLDASQRPIAALSILSADERRSVLHEWNATARIYPQNRTVHALFEAQAARTPEAPAVEWLGRTLSYADLNAQANRLAHHLRELGVGPEMRVGVCMSRCPELVVAVLAALKAGGAYVPLDPTLPEERLRRMVADSAPQVVVGEAAQLARLGKAQTTWVRMEDAAAWLQASAKDLPWSEVSVSPESLAYVLYTSGSTGEPKGVCMTHGALSNLLHWQSEVLPGAARTLQFAAVGFDVAFQEIFSTLGNGGTLVLMEDGLRQDVAALAKWVSEREIERLYVPYIALSSLAEVWSSQSIALPALREVMTAGEQLRLTPSIRDVFGRSTQMRLHNHYGPTESHVVTAHVLSGNPETWDTLPSIGAPIANCRIYVLDAMGEPVPAGVVGELYIGGAQVARGYWQREALSTERFLDDSFSETPSARMYKTGDLGRWLPDGNIEYLGRNDFQVKIRGFRIELGEIEAKLCALAGIDDAAVIAWKDGPGEQQLVAYYLAEDAIDAFWLREQLSQQLPEYMLPSAFVRLETWPVTSNGKLDRKSLPAPDNAAYARRVYAAPEGETEQALARIWSKLLCIEQIGRDDNFFELGGHSLLAIKLVHRIKTDIGHEISVTDVFDATTPARMAERIELGVPTIRAVDASFEAVLAEDIRLMHASDRPSSSPHGILLTGATGFVGRFLLRQILDTTEAKIYCLVRSGSEFKAFARIRKEMIKAHLWQEEDALRIVACPGDLSLPRLGLSPTDYARICDYVDVIYHNGTSMNHLESYTSAKRANVDGTQELLRIAAKIKPKTFNYISTLDVFSNLKSRRENEIIDEKSLIDQELHHERDGYSASKWVGEILVQIARTRGIPCNIFRLGLVVGDRRFGRYDEKQRLHRIMTSALLMGTGFANDCRSQYMLPVDYVAEAMVGLAAKYPQGGGVFHLVSTAPVSMDDIFAASTVAFGAPLRIVSTVEWLRQLGALHDIGTTLPIVPLLSDQIRLAQHSVPVLDESVDSAHVFDCTSTQNELAALGIHPPEMEMQLLALYWQAIRDAAEASEWSDRLEEQDGVNC